MLSAAKHLNVNRCAFSLHLTAPHFSSQPLSTKAQFLSPILLLKEVPMPQPSPSAASPSRSAFMDRVPRPPVLATPAEERRHRMERLAAAFRLFSRFGFDEGIARALGTKKAAILRNHGLLTVGHSVDEAAWWFITMDRSCQAQLLAEAAGEPRRIPHETAKHTYALVGSSLAGWFQFQPLYQRISREHPDLFE